MFLALRDVANEFAGTPLATMATDALNAQAAFVYGTLKDSKGGFYNGYNLVTGADKSAKKAECQAAIVRGLYAAYELTANSAYLDAANESYHFLIDRFYVSSEQIFRTEEENKIAAYNPFNLTVLSGGLREAAIVGKQTDAAAIYTRFFNKVYSPMLLAEAEVSGETGNDSDSDGIPYVAGGQVATVFAAEAEYNFTITSAKSRFEQSANLSIYPNPVSDKATISFENEGSKELTIFVMNIVGQKVQVIDTNRNRSIVWNTRELNNGIYFVRIESGGNPIAVKKVVINR